MAATTFLATATILLIGAALSSADVNVLKAGDDFREGDVLKYGSHSFGVTSDCNLELRSDQKIVWSSATRGHGKGCSLVLTKFGDLLLKAGDDTELWRSGTGEREGHYALVLQPNGDLAVLGDAVWSTGLHAV